MKKVAFFSLLLVFGLFGSQWLPPVLGQAYEPVSHAILSLMMIALSFIMIHVGYAFDLDKSNLTQYGWDYLVAFTAAAFPWTFVTLYFVCCRHIRGGFGTLGRKPYWSVILLRQPLPGCFSRCLAAAGLRAMWLFRKARILAIFQRARRRRSAALRNAIPARRHYGQEVAKQEGEQD
jgi:Na+:H+ antiporter